MLLCAAVCLNSCMTTRISVGTFASDTGETYQFDRGKQCYLFWGLLPLGRTSVNTPHHGNCQIRTKFNFTDWFVTIITGGLFSMQSVRVYAKHPDQVVIINESPNSTTNNSGGQ